jgi:hypothetical protein
VSRAPRSDVTARINSTLSAASVRVNRTIANMTAAVGSTVDRLRHPIEAARSLNLPSMFSLGGKNASTAASNSSTAGLKGRIANTTVALRARFNATVYNMSHPVSTFENRFNLTDPVARLEARLANVTADLNPFDNIDLSKVRDLVKVVNGSVATKISDTWDTLQARKIPFATILKVVSRRARAFVARGCGSLAVNPSATTHFAPPPTRYSVTLHLLQPIAVPRTSSPLIRLLFARPPRSAALLAAVPERLSSCLAVVAGTTLAHKNPGGTKLQVLSLHSACSGHERGQHRQVFAWSPCMALCKRFYSTTVKLPNAPLHAARVGMYERPGISQQGHECGFATLHFAEEQLMHVLLF